MLCYFFSVFFIAVYCCLFVKQKTAYELRISDWSSDVCSSDLTPGSAIRLRYRAYVSQDRRSSPRRTWHSEGKTPPAANSSLLQLPYQRQKRVAHSALRHWPYVFVANHDLLIDHKCFRHAIDAVVDANPPLRIGNCQRISIAVPCKPRERFVSPL